MRRRMHYTHGGMASFGAFHCINDAGHGGEGDQILVVWNSIILVDLMLLVGLFWQTITISTWKSIEFLKRPESFIFSSFAALLFQKKSKQVRLKCHKDLQDKLHEKHPKKTKNTTKLIACQRHICSSHCQRDVPNDRFVRDNRIQPVSEGTEIWNALWSIPPACWRQPEIASLNSLQGKKHGKNDDLQVRGTKRICESSLKYADTSIIPELLISTKSHLFRLGRMTQELCLTKEHL